MPKQHRKRYQVFISSTFRDLSEVRKSVAWTVLGMRHIPVGMENFGAAPDRGWPTIEKVLETSDYFVLVLGGRYGDTDKELGISWTEREYNRARELGIPVLAFLREPGSIVETDQDPDEASRARLKAFKEKVEKTYLRMAWRAADDLGKSVMQSLLQVINDDEDTGNERPGWFRGDVATGPQVTAELARLSAENAALREQAAAVANVVPPELHPEYSVDFQERSLTRRNGKTLVTDNWRVTLGVRNANESTATTVRVDLTIGFPPNSGVLKNQPDFDGSVIRVRNARLDDMKSAYSCTCEIPYLHGGATDVVCAWDFSVEYDLTDTAPSLSVTLHAVPTNGSGVKMRQEVTLEPTEEQLNHQ